MPASHNVAAVLRSLGLSSAANGALEVRSPIDGRVLAHLEAATPQTVHSAIAAAQQAFAAWRLVPAPVRGQLVRQFADLLRQRKNDLAELVCWETGKIFSEALGEVQEMIDIADLAVGLSRQLYGLTMPSERPGHRLMEQWHPLGPVGIVTAFNFPVAVWAWNALLALVCGDTLLWKPSPRTPLCALACQNLLRQIAADFPQAPANLSAVLIGAAEVGQTLAEDSRLPLISFTGSVAAGRKVAGVVAQRLGRCLLELGGNNAMILAPSADLDLALRAVVFSAAATCGQRCTTLRRLIVHESFAHDVVQRLCRAYQSLRIGNPLDEGVLIGPIIDEAAAQAMQQALALAAEQGGIVHGGGRQTGGVPAGGVYVRPAIVEIAPDAPIVQQETFAPILYVMQYQNLDQALAIHNAVPQGLSSAIFTGDLREAEQFLGPAGSDCGIANVNLPPSGAEIGGAFGGEKQTGGGREAGSDAWKNYLRRTTNVINASAQLPLAQGVRFDPPARK